MAEEKSSTSLKDLNFKWLWLLVGFDVAAVALIIEPGLLHSKTSWEDLAQVRNLGGLVLPIVTLLISNLFSQTTRARLVFWRWANPLPGSMAFTRFVNEDTRIDKAALLKRLGSFPTDPREQNATWYGIYRAHKDEAPVLDAHKLFLMYRDMASLSIVLLALFGIALWYAGVSRDTVLIGQAVFAAQYIATMIGARHAGSRLVCTVLAIESHEH